MNRLQLRAEHSAKDFYNRRQIPMEEALAGDGVGNLNVSGRLGWLYVRMRGDSTKVTVAYNASSHAFAENDAVSLQWVKRTGIGFYAIVGYSGAAVYDVFGAGSGDGTGSAVAYHAWQHERMDGGTGGPDPLDIFARMVVPLRARPQTVPDDTLYVEAGLNPLTGNWFAGGNSASFFPVPGTPGQARIDLLYLGSDDLLHIVAGTPVGGGITPTLPAVVVPSVPLAFVHLANAQTIIVEGNVYLDPGILRAPVLPGASPGHTIQDEGSDMPAEAHLNFVGAGVTVTDDAGNTATVVTIPGGGGSLDWFNVRDYGAVGDGSADDTTPVSDTITALTAAGGGVLFFPAGTYKTSGGFVLTVPTFVLGEGAFWASAVSEVTCTSATAVLFTVSAAECVFSDIFLLNTAGSIPSNGSGISVQAHTQQTYLSRVAIKRFYIDLDIQASFIFKADSCKFVNPVLYGVKLRDTFNADEGDSSFSNCDFNEDSFAATAFHIESSGGVKVVNCKINAATNLFVHGIELAVGATVSTADLLVANTSIENLSGDGIHITTNAGKPSGWVYIIINGVEIALGGANTTGHAIEIACDALNDVRYVTIGDCVLVGAGGNGGAAINLVKADNVYLSNNAWGLFGSLLAQSGCTNVFQTGSGTVTSVGSGTGLTGGPITGSGTISLANTAVAIGTYGDATNVPQITIDQQGRITGASNIAISGGGGGGWQPVTNGNAAAPEIVFMNGDVVMAPM